MTAIRVLYVESGESGTGGSFESLYQEIAAVHPDPVDAVAIVLNDSWCVARLRELGVPCYRLAGHLYDRERRDRLGGRTLFRIASVLDRVAFFPLSPAFDWIVHRPLIRRVQSIARRHRVDLIHLNTQIHRDFFAALAARACRVPFVSHLRSYFEGLAPAKARAANRWASAYLAITAGVRDHWVRQGVAADRTVILHNSLPDLSVRALDLTREWGVPAGSRVVGCIGRMTERRHFDWAIRAFEKVRASHIALRLVIVGDGERRGDFRELVERAGLSGEVLMPGYDPRGMEFLAAVDVFVECRDVEPFGRVLLEAWQVGTPAVLARVEPLEDIVVHGTNALLYEPGSAEDLARQIDLVLSDEALARRLADGGKETCRRLFGDDLFRRELAGIYGRVLSRNRIRTGSFPARSVPTGSPPAGGAPRR
ncbi:MAG: glycosyltransferase [Planctomycetes bacterium]|nr:glycosyltransferase [Planctomycetota bacterium]